MFHILNTISQKLLPAWLYKKLITDWDKDGLKRYFYNTGWMFFARIGSIIVSLLATLYIARQLGPTSFGELSYAISFVALFSFIATFGIDSVLYRELIKYPEKRNEFMGSAFMIRIVMSVIAIILTIISALLFSPQDVSFYLIALLSISFIFQSFYIISYEFQATVQARYISILSLVITIILNVLKIAVIFLGKGVIYLALILLLESILYAVGNAYLRHVFFGKLSLWKFDKNIAKKILIDSWPFIFTGAFTVIYTRIDQVMLKNIIDATSVGIYDAAVRISELWYFIPAIIVSSLFPAIINAKGHSAHEYKKRAVTLFFLLLGITTMIAMLMSTFAKPIISFVFGSEFQDSAMVLKIYIWALVPTSIIILLNYILLAENKKMILFFSALLGMIINIYLNYMFIPRYEANGAAVATLISSSVVVLFLAVFFLKKIKNLIK